MCDDEIIMSDEKKIIAIYEVVDDESSYMIVKKCDLIILII
jgi:hypothetical protein